LFKEDSIYRRRHNFQQKFKVLLKAGYDSSSS
jgi:hypothetical protein